MSMYPLLWMWGGWGQGVGGPWTRDTGSYLHNHHRFPRVVYHWGLVYNHHECMHAYTHTSMYMYILRDLDQWCCGTLRRQDVMVKKKRGSSSNWPKLSGRWVLVIVPFTHIVTLVVASTVRMKPLFVFCGVVAGSKAAHRHPPPKGKEQLVRFKCSLMKLWAVLTYPCLLEK